MSTNGKRLGELLLHAGVITKRQLQKAIDIKNDFTEAYNNLGAVMIDTNKFKNSMEFFNKAIKLKPNYAEAHYNLGLAYSNLKNFQKFNLSMAFLVVIHIVIYCQIKILIIFLD